MEFKKHLIRGHLTLSPDMTEEEMKEAIADFWGVPISNIPPINKQAFLGDIRNTRYQVNDVTAELKAKLESLKNTRPDKFEELDEVGRFIVAKNDFMKLIVPEVLPPHPDFLISYNNHKIGLEHTRLVVRDMKKSFETVKYCLKKAEALLSEELGHLSKTVNISVDYDKPLFGKKCFFMGGLSREEKEEVWISVANFVRCLLTNGEVKKPDFINQFSITPNKDLRIDIAISERFITEINIAPGLLERIANKEDKADSYYKALSVDLLGLLIVLDDLNSVSGFDLDECELPIIKESKFDNIFLFEKQSGRIKLIYANNSLF